MADDFGRGSRFGGGDSGGGGLGGPPTPPSDPWAGLKANVPVQPVAGTMETVELVGNYLRAEGSVNLGRFRRLTDYVNLLTGYFTIQDVTLLSRLGEPTRIQFPDLRVRLGDIAIVGQRQEEAPPDAGDHFIPKQRRRLVVMTAAHIVYGFVYLHVEASMTAFIDSTDPRFVPMTSVRVRWLTDRRLAGRYPLALIQRNHIIGVATEVGAKGLSLIQGRGRRAERAMAEDQGEPLPGGPGGFSGDFG